MTSRRRLLVGFWLCVGAAVAGAMLTMVYAGDVASPVVTISLTLAFMLGAAVLATRLSEQRDRAEAEVASSRRLTASIPELVGGFLAGFFVLVAVVPPGLGGLVERVQAIPELVRGTPLYESDRLDKELAVLREEYKDREVLSVLVYSGSINVSARSATDPEGVDQDTWKSGEMTNSFGMSSSDDPTFSIVEVSADRIRAAAREVLAEQPGADPGYIGVSRNYRPGAAIRQAALTIYASVDGKYRATNYYFDAVTGETIPEQD